MIYNHEWIKIHGIVICHWCGIQRKKETKDNSCTSKVKFITSGKELQVVKR